jgi:hypothetical protein
VNELLIAFETFKPIHFSSFRPGQSCDDEARPGRVFDSLEAAHTLAPGAFHRGECASLAVLRRRVVSRQISFARQGDILARPLRLLG